MAGMLLNGWSESINRNGCTTLPGIGGRNGAEFANSIFYLVKKIKGVPKTTNQAATPTLEGHKVELIIHDPKVLFYRYLNFLDITWYS